MKTALTVDDIESVRFFRQLLLTQARFETLVASHGQQALRFSSNTPSIW